MLTLRPELPGVALGVRKYGLHVHDVDQELRTMCNRHLFETPVPDGSSDAWRGFRAELRRLADEIGYVEPSSNAMILRGKSGRLRKRYKRGMSGVIREGVKPAHARVTAMQKLELYEVDQIFVKEDRGIQYRTVEYNAALARHLRGIEERLMGCVGNNVSGLPFMAKGRTLEERAVLLMKMSDSFDDPIYIEDDHSRFDAHVHPKLLQAEHSVYLRCRKWNRELAMLLDWQINNIGTTKGGIRYRSKGKRMSGDCNTALGNSVINYGLLSSWLAASGVSGNILLDGDDSVVVIERRDLERLIDVQAYMEMLGMETEYAVKDSISEVDFCQGRIVLGSKGAFFCCNPLKILETITMSAESRGTDTMYQIARASIASTLSMSQSMPMMKPFSDWCRKQPGLGMIPEREHFRYIAKGVPVKYHEIIEWVEPTMEERMSFALAWGISPSEQIAFENEVVVAALKPPSKESKYRVKIDDDCDDVPDFGFEIYGEPVEDLSWEGQSVEFRRHWTKQIT